MRYSISYSTIGDMLSLCNKLNTGEANKEDVRELLKHEDYVFELERYGSRVSEDDFVDYFLNIPNLDEEDIRNDDLKIHHKYYKDLINNLDFYIEKFEEFKNVLTKELFEEQIKIALKGLPDNIKLPHIKFIFTIGIGQSFGYAHKDGTHYDFLQLVKEKSIKEFCSTISHEVHHVGVMGPLIENIDGNEFIGVAYILKKDSWGYGYASEGVGACIEFAFNKLEASKVIAQIRPSNINSSNVAKKLNMKIEGSYVKIYDNKEMEHIIYSINKEDYYKGQNS